MPEVLNYLCPYCGSDVRVGEPCPGCAKKARKKKTARKSWEQSKKHDGLDLPDDNFDYDDFVAREFGKKPHHALGLKWYWWALGVVVLAALVVGIFLR